MSGLPGELPGELPWELPGELPREPGHLQLKRKLRGAGRPPPEPARLPAQGPRREQPKTTAHGSATPALLVFLPGISSGVFLIVTSVRLPGLGRRSERHS